MADPGGCRGCLSTGQISKVLFLAPGSVRVFFYCGRKMFFYLRNILFVSLLLFIIVSYSPDRNFGRIKVLTNKVANDRIILK